MKDRINHIEGLDSLRALSIIFVLLLHGSYGHYKGGWVGVDIFFVVSGFLITSILYQEFIKKGSISLINFYMRRALRLFPALFLAIIISAILWRFSCNNFLQGYDFRLAILGAFFYFTNLIPGEISGNMSHFWSLAVEEHFYLFWPLVLTFFFFKINRRIGFVILSVIVLLSSLCRIFAFRNQMPFFNTGYNIDFYRFTFCRIDALLLGSVLSLSIAYFRNLHLFKNPKVNLIWLIIVFFIMIFVSVSIENANPILNAGFFIAINLLIVLMVFLVIQLDTHFLFENRVINWIGRRSYGIYLFHFPIFLYFENYRVNHDAFNFIIITILRLFFTFLICGISYKYLEKPILAYKSRFL